MERIPNEETAVTSNPSDLATCDEERAAKAILYRDIEVMLPRLRRYARSLTRDVADADDLVQECVARALAKVHLWQAGTDLRARLFSIVHNHYVSQFRRTSRESKTVDWNGCTQGLTYAPEQIEHLELRELEWAIMSLPEPQRTAVLLIGLTPGNYYQVAAACDVSVGTIRSRLARGRKALRELTGVALPQRHISAGREAFPRTPATTCEVPGSTSA